MVAELNGAIVGFVTILAKVQSDEIEGGEIESNWGMLSGCAAGDDGTGTQIAVAFCDIDFTYDPALPFPKTGVSANCVGLVTASSAAAMQSAKEELAAKVGYQASMGKPTSAVQLRKAATSKHK